MAVRTPTAFPLVTGAILLSDEWHSSSLLQTARVSARAFGILRVLVPGTL